MSDSEIAVRLSIPTSRVKKLASYYLIPEEFKKSMMLKVTHGGEKKAGKIPISIADNIMKIRKTIGMKKEESAMLFEHAKQDGFSNEKLSMVAGLVKQGHTVKKAIELQDEYIIVRVSVPIHKAQMNRLLKKHKTQSKQDILVKILDGRIRERIITNKI